MKIQKKTKKKKPFLATQQFISFKGTSKIWEDWKFAARSSKEVSTVNLDRYVKVSTKSLIEW